MLRAALLASAAATSLASPVPVTTAGAMKMNPDYGLPRPGTWYAYNNTDMYVSLDKRVGMTEWPIAYLAEAPVAGDAPVPPPPPAAAASSDPAECTGTYTSMSFSVSRWSSTSDADSAAQPTHSAWFSYTQGAQRNCTDADNVTDPAASGPVVKEAGGVEGGVGLGGDSGGDATRLPADIMPPFAPVCCEDNVMWYGDKPLTDGDFTWSTDDSGSLFANATLTIPVTGSSTTAAVTTDLGAATAAVAVVFNCLPPGVGVTEGNGTTKQCQGTTCVLSTDASATTTCAFNQGAAPGAPGITAADAFDATGTLEVVGQEGVNFNLEDLPDGFLVSISSTNSTSSTRVTAA